MKNSIPKPILYSFSTKTLGCNLHKRLQGVYQHSGLIALALLFAGQTSVAEANPQGGNVVAGQATINQESATTTTIQQTTDKAIINWQQFNIGQGQHTQFVQPSQTAVTLNRVIGQDPSQILGQLTANGQVFLVNPNGIVFGKDAKIDVAALVASTANITDKNFMASRYEFNIPGASNAQIINRGNINIKQGGLVALVAPHVENQGVIVAKLGRVVLAAGDTFTLDLYGDDLIALETSSELLANTQTADGQSLKQLISNSGTIQADGGYVLLTTDVAKDVLDQVINMDGYISARSAEEHDGTIVLKGGDTAEINIAGNIDVSGAGESDGGEVRLFSGNTLNIGANTKLLAKGGEQGGDGGFIETSASQVNIESSVDIDTSARFGSTGTWLLDPTDYYISASNGDITGAILGDFLGLNNVTIQTAITGVGNGDIFVNDSISWNNSNKLILTAHRDINVNEAIISTGGGRVNSPMLFPNTISVSYI